MDAQRSLEEINTLFPEHSRTSCSDDNLYNAGIDESGNLWCPRCQSLQELKMSNDIQRLTNLLESR